MPGNDSSPKSTALHTIYHSIEQVNEVLCAAGWAGEFCQLRKGRVTSRWLAMRAPRWRGASRNGSAA